MQVINEAMIEETQKTLAQPHNFTSAYDTIQAAEGLGRHSWLRLVCQTHEQCF